MTTIIVRAMIRYDKPAAGSARCFFAPCMEHEGSRHGEKGANAEILLVRAMLWWYNQGYGGGGSLSEYFFAVGLGRARERPPWSFSILSASCCFSFGMPKTSRWHVLR